MLETALVLSTLLGMIIFVMDMGRMLLWQQFFMERARTGVRNAVVNNWDSTSVANYVCYGTTTAPALSPGDTSEAPGYLGLVPSEVTFNSIADSGANDARYQVIIQGVDMFSWIPGMAGRYRAAPLIATMPVESAGATT